MEARARRFRTKEEAAVWIAQHPAELENNLALAEEWDLDPEPIGEAAAQLLVSPSNTHVEHNTAPAEPERSLAEVLKVLGLPLPTPEQIAAYAAEDVELVEEVEEEEADPEDRIAELEAKVAELEGAKVDLETEAEGKFESEEQGEAPVIDLKAPMKTAEMFVARWNMVGGKMTLRRWQESWWEWQDSVWEEISHETVRDGGVYRFLKGAVHWAGKAEPVEVEPTPAIVNAVTDALGSVTFLNSRVGMPGWTGKACPVEDVRQLVSMENGLLDLRSRRLLRHTPEFWSGNTLGYGYDPTARCPRFEQFMGELWPGDKEVWECVQELFGLLLTDVTRCQKMFMFVGPPRGGRGTIGRVLTGLIGRENVAGATFAGLAGRFGLEGLVGKKLALFADATMESIPKKEKVIITERVKMITGEDALPVERKNRVDFNMPLTARLVTFSNQPLEFVDHTGAISARVVTVEMKQSFAARPDRMLTDKLLAERAGIFNWALDGLDRLRGRDWQFRQPQSGEALAAQLARMASTVRAFVEDRCEDCEAGEAVKIDFLFSAFKGWCERQNVWAGTKEQFSSNLRAVRPDKHIGRPRHADGSRDNAIYGLRLVKRG